jgi:hypothetical protein
MNDSKHTPGPWEIDDEAPGYINAAGIPIAQVFDNPDTGMEPLDEEPSTFNARLITAAPDLLEALKKCAAVCSGDTMNKRALIDALKAAKEAIQKAEGAK